MRTPSVRASGCLAAIAFALLPAACRDSDLPTAGEILEEPVDAPAPAFPQGEPLKVLTRNMYMGGDVGIVFGADLSDPGAVAMAATQVWGQIQASNFPERAEALAEEIARARPHLVAIQEIPQFVILDQGYNPIGVQDHLQILMDALAGTPYTVEAVQNATVAVMPVILDSGLHYVQFTDRIAVLVRNDLQVTGGSQGVYQAYYPLGPNLDLQRGWIRVSAEVAGIPYHFVATHLEGQSLAPIQALQTQELIESVTAGLDGVTVLMGDLNSDAEGGPGVPSWTPSYQTLLEAGFQDAWALDHPGLPHIGFTCCQDKDLLNPISDLEERIDFVLLRSGESAEVEHGFPGSVHVEIIGEADADRTPISGLWPSDHAGLLASLRLPSGIFGG